MQYLTFETYQSMGGSADSLLFARLEMSARFEVDKNTFNRLEAFDILPDVLPYLMLELVELTRKNTANNTRQTASESNNGVTVSYVVKKDEELEIEKVQCINLYLSKVRTSDGNSILYRGLNATIRN